MRTLTRVVLEAKRNSSGRRAQAEYAEKHPDSDVAKRVAARAHGAKPNSAGLKKDFIGRFKPKEGQHARHQQTGMTAQERATNRGVEDTASYKTGRVKARQIVRRGGKIPAPTGQELDDLTSRTRANEPPRGRGDRVKKVGPSGRKDETAYPLTADRVFMFEGSFQNMRRAAKAGNQYAADRMMAKNLGKSAEYYISSKNTGSLRGGIADSLVQAGKTNKNKAKLKTIKAEQRVDEISAEKYDAMSGKERSDYAGKVARRYRRMADAKKAKDKNFTPDKDLSRPLSAHREIKDRAYARAGRHEELKKLRARRKQPLKSSGMGGRDRGEEMAREAGDRR